MGMHLKASASLLQANDLLSLGAGGGAGDCGRKFFESGLRVSRQAQSLAFELQCSGLWTWAFRGLGSSELALPDPVGTEPGWFGRKVEGLGHAPLLLLPLAYRWHANLSVCSHP